MLSDFRSCEGFNLAMFVRRGSRAPGLGGHARADRARIFQRPPTPSVKSSRWRSAPNQPRPLPPSMTSLASATIPSEK